MYRTYGTYSITHMLHFVLRRDRLSHPMAFAQHMFCPIAHIAAAIEVDLVSDVCDDAAPFCHSGRTKGHQVVLQEIQPSCLPSTALTQGNHRGRLTPLLEKR